MNAPLRRLPHAMAQRAEKVEFVLTQAFKVLSQETLCPQNRMGAGLGLEQLLWVFCSFFWSYNNIY